MEAPLDKAKLAAPLMNEIARLNAMAGPLLDDWGKSPAPTVAGRLAAIAEDPRWLYPDNDTGRATAVMGMNGRLDIVRAALPKVVRTVPPEAAAVTIADSDGKPGFRDAAGYHVDLSHIRGRPTWTLGSVVHHETLPGHLLQIPMQARAAPHPYRLQFTQACSEGWAIYAEQLAAERLELFRGDPLGMLGYIQWRLFRLARMAIDLERTPPDRGPARLARVQGFPAAFISFEDDAKHIFAAPGKVAGEMAYAMELAELAAQTKLDRRDFHTAVLRHGPLPARTAERLAMGVV